MSTSKAEKEKLQLIQEKSQQILSELLKDEDNKYCVDCDAKGPRWASWNLGVFLCIRCAGIHRNLGVHISKVKSVNLDSWSPEQIGYMQMMGNSKARAVYEANLPDNFKRPQADSGLEAFVRAKYEHKQNIAKEWVEPPTPKPAFDIEEERKKDKEKKRSKIIKVQTNSTIVEVQTNPVPRPHSSPAGTAINAEKVLITNKSITNGVKTLPSTDLLGLTTTTTSSAKGNSSDDDQFDVFVSCAPVIKTDDLVKAKQEGSVQSGKTDEEEDFFSQKVLEQKKLDKESILKLYESSSNNLTQTPVNNHHLFNMTSSTTTPLQPMNILPQSNGFTPTSGLLQNGLNNLNQQAQQLANNLFNTISPPQANNNSNVINNGFANFNDQPANLNQQPFLAAFNQTPAAAAVVQPTPLNHNSNNPFLNAPPTNGTTTLNSSDLFSSSNLNTNLSTTLESQLNGLNLHTAASDSTISWPNSTPTSNISVGQSLFSTNFDVLNEKLNGFPNVTSTAVTNPFVVTTSNPLINSSIQAPPSQTANNLDLFSSFSTISTTVPVNGLGINNNDLNDLEGWSSFHTATATTTNSSLTADIWQ